MRSILFVCLGNICRSAAAQTIMQKKIDEAGLSENFKIDSAGLLRSNEGRPADARMQAHAARRGYDIRHFSRPVEYGDFFEYDLIIGMDASNIDSLKDKAPGIDEEGKIRIMTDFCLKKVVDHVPDPYYGGSYGFENVMDILEDACEGLFRFITGEDGPQSEQ